MSAQEHLSLDALATISAEDLLAAILGMPQIAPLEREPPAGVTPMPSPSALGGPVRAMPPTAYADDWEWMRAGNEVEAAPVPAPSTPAPAAAAASPAPSANGTAAAAGAGKPKRRRLNDADERVQRRRESIRESQRRIRSRQQESFQLYKSFFEWAGEMYPNILGEFSELRKKIV